jgi:glucuronoarabinoxylan endo-1,4-beta-xylanase
MARVISAFVLAGMVHLSAFAGVMVTQNVSPGATTWPGSPIITSVTNPASQTSVGESFNAVGGCTNYCQTFTITTTNYTLQTVSIYAGAGTGTGTGTNITLRLFDLGTQTAPNPSPYIPGTDLFSSGNGLAITYTPQAVGVLQFDFTGSDQVTLQSGHLYAFEMDGVLNSSPLLWQRTTNDTYSGGAAYRNRSWINGNNARDFALAVYGAVTTNASATNASTSGQCTVDWNNLHQRIDGFGGGVVFLDSGLDPVTDANMNTLFGTNSASQLGLSLLRVRIDPTTNWSTALSDAKKAVGWGAGILATPWTPPASMKSNNNIVGGSLLAAQYASYANYLNNFAAYMATNGASLAAISVQNEPDANVTYESCVWTPAQLQAFCHTNASAITNAPVMMPESESYNTSYSDPTLDDPVAAANVTFIGGHLYGNGNAGVTVVDYPNAHNNGKPTWMTEFLVNDQTIGTAITTAQQIHNCLTVGNMSAYIWWKCLGDANGLVNASGVPQIRGFVMAQFSRFVRPNYYRIDVANGTNTLISAYKSTNSPNFSIVAINTNLAASVTQTIGLTNFNAASVTPWITSGTMSLAVQTPVNLTNSSFTYTLPPLSVVTFVGQMATNTPPVLAAIANQTINAGVFLTITNTASDTNLPAQTLTFALLSAPTNAALTQLNNTNAIFTWRPLVSQAGTTNSVAVRVSDGGSPVLSATNHFVITVNPASQPVLGSIVVGGGQVSLTGTGLIGPDYTLLTSTNLANWQPLFTTNPAAMPVTFTDTNRSAAARFYRLQLGP